MELYLLTLLVNLAEGDDTSARLMLQIRIVSCNCFDLESCHNIDELRERYYYCDSDAKASKFDYSNDVYVGIVEQLVKMLLQESTALLKDIENTDNSNKTNHKGQVMNDKAPDDFINENGNINVEMSCSRKFVERLPLAEIIISAHICMLLLRLVMTTCESDNDSDC